ncbi:DEAD-domain-containing protein [Cylindrobasidium torrendii FP15055 ss-10]|uniref:ATP-dependent RNA helicase n=1 Tax=Cylindrobasidium torrendii FP15055 ss-10 TaxID=1314674 RepID=A0A0D7BW78_9AGAR|nr:DEAD-domain-containing protein [Cylindrobasidium torrendii FP15055 ss-10]
MDDIVLNLASDDAGPSRVSSKKGGRWTDRAKAKRGLKRKSGPEESATLPTPKRSRVQKPGKSHETALEKTVKPSRSTHTSHGQATAHTPQPRPQGQIISSLFSYNPKVELPSQPTPFKAPAKPSNAPLTDSSSFDGLGVDPLIGAHLSKKMEIEKPTAIQRAVLPAILRNPDVHRDIFIQSQTGSGKTLAFLIPIIQDLLPLSTLSYIDRSIGTLAIIIAPTRELAQQISEILEALLKMRLRPEDASADDPASARFTRWLVSGLLIGGNTRTHEKARLRKGLPIVVSTPGRLLDHLQHSESFNVGKCRWLVMDEADRLMDLGFEETITGILKGLEARRNLAIKAAEQGAGHEVGGWDWERRRRTILCSATMKEGVQNLAGTALDNPLLVKATESDAVDTKNPTVADADAQENYTPPAQLSQRYIVAPLKQRLVTLIALLRTLITSRTAEGTKIVVFFSCTDSVDFHWQLLGRAKMNDGEEAEEAVSDDDDEEEEEGKAASADSQIAMESSLLPGTSIYRLHGSLATQTRNQSLKQFSNNAAKSSILFSTSVASRGLDLPQVRAVVQYDLPTEGGAAEYVHRVGRTARAGKAGEAWSILTPSEQDWVKWVEGQMKPEKVGDTPPTLQGVTPESILQRGFGGKGAEYEARATDVQLTFERWALQKENLALAQQAFLSHMRAYATHPSTEKHIFHVRHLHLGHLAKAFALRDAPKSISGKGKSKKATDSHPPAKKRVNDAFLKRNKDTEARMEAVVRSQGRLTKKKGMMVSSGADEFQLAGGYNLEKMFNS